MKMIQVSEYALNTLKAMAEQDAKDAESWKEVDGYGGAYLVSSIGRVKSVARVTANRKNKSEMIMLQSPISKGYLRVTLWSGGHKKDVYVHRLVASAFCEKQNGKDQVNHKDGDKLNNHFSNLEWCTPKENSVHAAKVLMVYANKEIVGVHQKTGELIRFNSFGAAQDAGFHRSLIHKTIIGKRTHHAGYKWFYADEFETSPQVV